MSINHGHTKDSLVAFESFLCEEFKKGRINCPLHLNGGNEEQLLSIFEEVLPWDYVFSTHRNHYHYLLKGGNHQALVDEIFGLTSGINGGYARSMNIIDPSINFYSTAIVGGNCALSIGIGLSIKKKFKGKDSHPRVWVFVGDGAEDSGHFVEAVRFANSRGLPITFVIEDNDFSIESSKKDRWHNHKPIKGSNIIRYEYNRVYPHVGIGEWVSF